MPIASAVTLLAASISRRHLVLRICGGVALLLAVVGFGAMIFIDNLLSTLNFDNGYLKSTKGVGYAILLVAYALAMAGSICAIVAPPPASTKSNAQAKPGKEDNTKPAKKDWLSSSWISWIAILAVLVAFMIAMIISYRYTGPFVTMDEVLSWQSDGSAQGLTFPFCLDHTSSWIQNRNICSGCSRSETNGS